MEKRHLIGKLTDDLKFIQINEEHIHERILRKYADKELEIEMGVLRRNRSSAANRYFHGVVCITIISFEKRRGADWLRNLTSKEAMDCVKAHIYQNVLKQKIEITVVDGVEVFIQKGKRLSEMNSEEFFYSVEEIRNYYNEKGCPIPTPIKDGFISDYLNAQKK